MTNIDTRDDMPLQRFVAFDECVLQIAEIASIRMVRGHTFTKLVIRMRDGFEFEHNDRDGSAYEIERRLKVATGVA